MHNIGSGDGLMLSDMKPLSEPMAAKFFDAIWVSFGHSECKIRTYILLIFQGHMRMVTSNDF